LAVLREAEMTWMYTPYAGIMWATAFISAFAAYLISRKLKTVGMNSLVLLMSAASVSALASGLEAASVGLGQKLIWSKVEYVGGATIPTLFFVFALDYCLRVGRIRKLYLFLLAIVPIAFLAITLTNEYHFFIWKSFALSPAEPNTILYTHGIGYYIFYGYDYIVALAGLIIMARGWFKFPLPYKRQIGIIILGFLFPFVSGIVYALGITPFPGLDITVISFMGTAIVLIGGIFINQLFDLVPITSDALIENMLDGVLVLDALNNIASVNPVAVEIIPSLSKNPIGKPVERYLSFWKDVNQRYPSGSEIRTEVMLRQKPICYVDVHISSLYDRNRQFAGRLVTLRDTSARRKTETDLARNVEELKIINRISLIITSGLNMERTLKALYEQCSRVAPIDIFYVALYNPSSSLVDIPVYYEKGKCLTGISRDIRDHPGLIGSVIQARRTIYLHDGIKQVTRPLVLDESASAQPINSYIGIPLTAREQIIGVMAIQSHQSNAYTADHVRLLERIAVQAAIAIENARLYSEEQRLAIVDELTGVYNYRGLMELGNREVERARRFNRPLAAIFFDIDNFRDLNNTYSHTAGNLVLKAVVKRCSLVLRSVDVLTRFGGDEFVALLPETDLASAEAVAQRLVQEIAATPINTTYGELKVSISVGVYLLSNDAPDLPTLIDHANRAERQVKISQKKLVNQT
jgi:diguanylate cyclase (GGDEF)-like protein